MTDADLGELRDRLAERRQVIEVEVVARVDAEAGLLCGLGCPGVAPQQRRRLAARPGVGIGAGVQLDPIAALAIAPGSGSMNRLTRAPLFLSSRMTERSARKLAFTSQP
jgi:hypothetical protein